MVSFIQITCFVIIVIKDNNIVVSVGAVRMVENSQKPCGASGLPGASRKRKGWPEGGRNVDRPGMKKTCFMDCCRFMKNFTIFPGNIKTYLTLKIKCRLRRFPPLAHPPEKQGLGALSV
jgi:hypothetical protein